MFKAFPDTETFEQLFSQKEARAMFSYTHCVFLDELLETWPKFFHTHQLDQIKQISPIFTKNLQNTYTLRIVFSPKPFHIFYMIIYA